MNSDVMKITPEIAQEMLNSNIINRHVSINAYECGVPSDTLKKFTQIVRTGFYNDESEVAAVIIRNDIISGALQGKSIVQSAKSSCMVENAIKDFVAGYKRKKTYKNSTARVYEKREG